MTTFDSMLFSPSIAIHDTVTHQPGEVLNMITILDTGGQPEYIHLLPTINIYPTVTFVVHDLSKSLDDQVLVEYSQHGEHVFVPYHLNYTNMDMIKLLMSAANDAVGNPSNIPYLVSTPGSNNDSYICLVGTHADKVPKDDVAITENKLVRLVNSTQCQASVWYKEDGAILFPVDNTTAGSEETEDPVANILRTRIEMVAAKRDVHEVPITWMLLQLEIHFICYEKQKTYITVKECVEVARNTGLISNKAEVKSVLLYYHYLRVLIYFQDVPGLCDYVIVDHQWWFDKLSGIITATFQQAQLNFHAVQKLKYEGILSKELLQCIKWEDEIKEEFFLALLVHMKIIAAIATNGKKKGQYFIPYVLPTYSLDQKTQILGEYGSLQGVSLLIRFQSGLLPRGLFCSLIVELLQNSPKEWRPHFSHEGTHHTFSNLITFSLPDGYSLSLFDQVSYLEIQMRHPKAICQRNVHTTVYSELVQAIIKTCVHVNFDHSKLQHGFLCDCGKITDNHIATIPTMSHTPSYADCSINTAHRMELTSSHLIWLSKDSAMSANNGKHYNKEQYNMHACNL